MRAGSGLPQEIRPCPAFLRLQAMLLTTRSKQVQEIFKNRFAAQDEARENLRRQTAPHKPISEVLEDGAWAGQPCFLIGGGPSLTGFDFERLRGRGRVIAINRAFEFIPWADMLFFMDWKFYNLCHNDKEKLRLWQEFQGIKLFCNLLGRKTDDCYSVRGLGRHGMSWSLKKGVFHGNNSGHGALEVALALGCRPIYLLGYDMNGDPRGHFHSGYGHRTNRMLGAVFLKHFLDLAQRIPRVSYIYNCNPDSGLRAWPFKTIDEVLNDQQAREGLGNDQRGHDRADIRDPSIGDRRDRLLQPAPPRPEG